MKVRVCQVSAVKRYVVRDMQRLRKKVLTDLEDVFDMARAYAKSEDTSIQPKQRQIWVRIMAYTGQVMNSISKSFDEAQTTKSLDNLEKMISEAMAKEKT